MNNNNSNNNNNNDNDNNNDNLRKLFYWRNPCDARVKVGSDREAASSPQAPNSGVGEIGVNDMGKSPRGPSKIGTVSGENTPKKLVGTAPAGPPQDPWFSLAYFLKTRQSDAQLFSTLLPISLVFIVLNFAPGPPKPSRNRPETARLQNRYFSKVFN